MNAREFGVPQNRRRAFAVFARDKRLLPERIPTPHTQGETERFISAWPDAFVEREFTDEERIRIVSRVENRAGKEERAALKLASRQFIGLVTPPAEWDRLCVFHCDSMRTSFHAGLAPTVMGGSRLMVRRTDGRIYWLSPEGYEWLMGCEVGYTAKGINDRGRLVEISSTARKEACGLGVATPIMESIARSLGCTGEEKKSSKGVVHGTKERASVGWSGRNCRPGEMK